MRIAGLILVHVALLAPAARAGTPADDLAWLNAKRAASGIPAGITENPEWSAACAQHLAYMRRTGEITHTENPASPHFTEAGNWAGGNAVLASADAWTADNFIWETAPLHLAQLLAPQLSQVGIADDGQYVCVTTWPGYLRTPPATDAIVAYPGPGTQIYWSEFSDEWPTTPAVALGLPNPTGPHILVYDWGPAAVSGLGADGLPIGVRRVFLRGPRGDVPVRHIDARSPLLGRYLPNAAAIIVPIQPLAPGTQYVVIVELTNGASAAWSFSTDDGGRRAQAFRDLRFGFDPALRRRVCVARRAGRCTASRLRSFTTLRLRGRFAAGGRRPAGIQITVDSTTRALAPLHRDGTFHADYVIALARGRQRLRITLSSGDEIAAYVVRIRPGSSAVGASLMGYADHTPISAARPRSAPDPRGTGPCSRCS